MKAHLNLGFIDISCIVNIHGLNVLLLLLCVSAFVRGRGTFKLSLYVWRFVHMSAVATEANRGQQITWSWSPRLLCIGYSGVPAAQNSGPLQQQCLLLTAPLQPMFYFGFHFLMVFFSLFCSSVSALWFSGTELRLSGYAGNALTCGTIFLVPITAFWL